MWPRNTSAKPGARERVLAAASRLFYQHGIHAVGVNAIASEAGVTKATLYAHFSSKDGLITEHLRARDRRWETELANSLGTQRHPAGQLDAIFAAYRAWAVADEFRGCGFVNAAAEIADASHPARAIVYAHKQAMRSRLEALAGAAQCPDPAGVAEQWFFLLEGAMLTAALRRQAAPLDHAREMAERLLPAHRA